MNNKRKDGPPLYVERSEVQQHFCFEFDLLSGKVLYNPLTNNLKQNERVFVLNLIYCQGKLLYNTVTNKLKQNKRVFAMNLLFAEEVRKPLTKRSNADTEQIRYEIRIL